MGLSKIIDSNRNWLRVEFKSYEKLKHINHNSKNWSNFGDHYIAWVSVNKLSAAISAWVTTSAPSWLTYWSKTSVWLWGRPACCSTWTTKMRRRSGKFTRKKAAERACIWPKENIFFPIISQTTAAPLPWFWFNSTGLASCKNFAGTTTLRSGCRKVVVAPSIIISPPPSKSDWRDCKNFTTRRNQHRRLPPPHRHKRRRPTWTTLAK